MIPFPTPAAIAYLASDERVNEVTNGRVSTELGPSDEDLPALRLTLIPNGTPKDWQWSAAFEVEAWAADEITAGNLIATVRDVWPHFRGYVLDGTAYVSGAWISWEPRALPDRDTGLYRYTLTAACHMHPPKEADNG